MNLMIISQMSKECDECLACILVNSMDLLRLDLDGVQMLVPCIIEALEVVLPDKDLKLKLVCSYEIVRLLVDQYD